MQPMARTKVTKRKLEAVQNKIVEPKCTKEPNTKFKILQEKFSAFEKENEKNIEIIKNLKEEILILSSKKSISTETTETQTEDDDENGLEFPCKVCIFVASCEDELRCHIDNEHELAEEPDVTFKCTICFFKAVNRGELLVHRKKSHPKSIKQCKYY